MVTSVGFARYWLKTGTHCSCVSPLSRVLIMFLALWLVLTAVMYVYGVSCCEAIWGRPGFELSVEGFVTSDTPITDGK